jgi:hypothetical protein
MAPKPEILNFNMAENHFFRIDYSKLSLEESFNLSIFNILDWCREGGANPHDPKIGGF